MADLTTFSNRRELVQAVTGKSDHELFEEAERAGAEIVVQKIFMGMLMAFDAGRARDNRVIIEYDIQGPARARYRYQVKVDGGQCTIDPEGTAKADLAFEMGLPTFLKVSTNTANPILLVLFRKLKVRGDRKLARQVPAWFSKRL